MPFNNKQMKRLMVNECINLLNLSYQTEIPVSTLQRCLMGKVKNPTFKTVETIAEYFKVSMDTFKQDKI